MREEDFFQFTKIKITVTVLISVIIIALLFNHFYYQFCATNLLCMQGDLKCQKAQFSERWFCPLIPSVIILPFILGITYLSVCTVIHFKKKYFPNYLGNNTDSYLK